MAVGPVGAEGEDHLWPDSAKVGGDPSDRFRGVGLVEVAVHVVQEADITDTQLLGGRQQLGLARLADDLQPR